MAARNASKHCLTTEFALSSVSIDHEAPTAGDFRRHAWAIVTTGSWSFRPQTSDDGGTTWANAGAALVVDNTSDTYYCDFPCNALRLAGTRTAGDATVWLRQSGLALDRG